MAKSFFARLFQPTWSNAASKGSKYTGNDTPESAYDEVEPWIKTDLDIPIDATNRDKWPSLVLQARRHMRCHPYHPKRLPKNYQPFQMVVDSPEDEGERSRKEVDISEPPTFPLFTELPKELRDKILLSSQAPIIMEGFAVMDQEWRGGPQAHFRSYRSWHQIPLYAVSRETRALAITFFGEPDPLSVPFNPTQDAILLDWDGSKHAERGWTGNHKSPGPVLTTRRWNASEEWAMPRNLCDRVHHVKVDARHAACENADKGEKVSWRLVFGLLKEHFRNMTMLEVNLSDLDDKRFEGTYDPVGQELYRIDQLDLFDELEEMSDDGRVPFQSLRRFTIIPELQTPLQAEREILKFRKAGGGHFKVFRQGQIPKVR
ncbi:uncharacterized protein BDZ83DRAFT_633268 [Colletotrichum acutatum]|uniref:2EXR domain-containing protein n=1 Tax=Glomerella acutata TaxID=27357 RepID=A0AAD8UHY7_GLOAC|nr:uncharacterized protein BDZ83DRAFT_633268 [Colletotrichum acutatum]KAK1718070.1 hypothetical protein BDZ83DRAFT_633268 [Colletotrichum acutatum]